MNLLWYVKEKIPGETRQRSGSGSRGQPPEYRAPTWSWASLDGVIGHDLLPADASDDNTTLKLDDDVAEIIDVHINPHAGGGSYSLGQVTGGSLTVRGRLCRLDGSSFKLRANVDDQHKPSQWVLENHRGCIMRVIPDRRVQPGMDHDPTPPVVFCLRILKLVRQRGAATTAAESEIQGLVLRLRNGHETAEQSGSGGGSESRNAEGNAERVFERVGLFTTRDCISDFYYVNLFPPGSHATVRIE